MSTSGGGSLSPTSTTATRRDTPTGSRRGRRPWRRASSRTGRLRGAAPRRPPWQPGRPSGATGGSRADGAAAPSRRLGLGCGGAVQDVRDAAARHEELRFAAPHGDLVVLDVYHLADDASRRDDLVAALERGEELFVLRLLPALRPDQEEVEDRDEGPDLEHEDREPAARVLTGGGEGEREQSERGHASSG